ncbi:DUF2637 domain-containing protein [Streptomyces sp. CAU 1734]|uniref:DUF2637 domain-containing protein n=1 Tax=Streptomyces sp. CAU 1734 TaxID=3140360 RepID=UPI00326152E8
MEHIRLNRAQRVLVAVVAVGAVVIAGIGFAGSYTAVRELAIRKGFGDFAAVFPIGVDAGIAVLLSLDLLLAWLRIPFPMLRQAAWLLTAATIGFNAAAAWPDPIGVGMHSVIPLLFVVTVEAARHAVSRLAAISADRHMESVRLWRWLLAPLPTFRLWRRMKLWEIRKYEDVILAEQQRLIYQARLRGRYGRGWRWKAPVEDLLPLKVARYGVPLEPSAGSDARRPAVVALDRDVGGVAPVEVDVAHGELERRAAGDTDDSRKQGSPSLEKVDQAPGGSGRAAAAHELPTGAAESEAERRSLPGTDREAVVVVKSSGQRSDDGEPSLTDESERVGRRSARKETGRARGKGTMTATATESSSRVVGEGQAVRTERREAVADSGGVPLYLASDEHRAAVEALKSNAAAVRYAMTVLGSTQTTAVVEWLAAQGREVNRGQAHKITKTEEERQRSGEPESEAAS